MRVHHAREYGRLSVEPHRRHPVEFKLPTAVWHLAFWPPDKRHPVEAKAPDQYNALFAEWTKKVNRFIESVTLGSSPNEDDTFKRPLFSFNSDRHADHIKETAAFVKHILQQIGSLKLPRDKNKILLSCENLINQQLQTRADRSDLNLHFLMKLRRVVEEELYDTIFSSFERNSSINVRFSKVIEAICDKHDGILGFSSVRHLKRRSLFERRTLRMKGMPHFPYISAQFEFHSDYASASFYLDLESPQLPPSLQTICKNMANLNANGNNEAVLAQFFEDIWQPFEYELEDVVVPGCVFANMRGVAIPASMFSDVKDKIPLGADGKPTWTPEVAVDFLDAHTDLRSAIQWPKGDPQSVTVDYPYVEPYQETMSRDMTAVLIDHGAALLLTSLGNAIRLSVGDVEAPSRTTALRFAFIYADDHASSSKLHQSSSARIQRALTRMGRAAMFRLIALKDADVMAKAGRDLREIGIRLNEISEKLTRPNYIPQRELDRIAHDLDSVGKDAVGGFFYRVSRSGYYSLRYKGIVSAIEAKEIPGYTPYRTFVKLRLYPQMDYIQRVFNRYERLRDRLNGIYEHVRTRQQGRLNIIALTFPILLISFQVAALTSDDTEIRRQAFFLILPTAIFLVWLMFYALRQIYQHTLARRETEIVKNRKTSSKRP